MNWKRCLRSLLMAATIATSAAITGCAVHAGYRVYDPYYSDYHVWDANETGYYNRWSVETHRDPHRDFHKLNHDEQKQYFDWRHSHQDAH